ncbi:MAG: lipase family protein, partial [Clostridia bacterium]|nr:lipase family protein [Clostridia bacterium]
MKLSTLFSVCLSIPYAQTGVSANYAIRREGDALYLFFEGSDGANDWKSNLDFPAKPYKRMGKTVWFAHRGFLRVWKELEPMLAADIADKSVRKLVIAGYSHGAALALLCHEYAWYHRPDLRNALEGYGFGGPRVLWGVLTKDIKSRFESFTLVRNIDDIVTHLPPAVLGYSHVGKLLEIGKKGKYTAVEAHLSENILA